MPSVTDTTNLSTVDEFLADADYPLFLVSNEDCLEEMKRRECGAVRINLLQIAGSENGVPPCEVQGIPLEGRCVFLAFDETIAALPRAEGAILDLTSYLRQQGATVARYQGDSRGNAAPKTLTAA